MINPFWIIHLNNHLNIYARRHIICGIFECQISLLQEECSQEYDTNSNFTQKNLNRRSLSRPDLGFQRPEFSVDKEPFGFNKGRYVLIKWFNLNRMSKVYNSLCNGIRSMKSRTNTFGLISAHKLSLLTFYLIRIKTWPLSNPHCSWPIGSAANEILQIIESLLLNQSRATW